MIVGVLFERILSQERTPVFTAISCLTTVGVEVVIILSSVLADFSRPGGEVAAALLVLAVAGGFVLNCIVGGIAAGRGEYLGLIIALIGILLWMVTVLGVYAVTRFVRT